MNRKEAEELFAGNTEDVSKEFLNKLIDKIVEESNKPQQPKDIDYYKVITLLNKVKNLSDKNSLLSDFIQNVSTMHSITKDDSPVKEYHFRDEALFKSIEILGFNKLKNIDIIKCDGDEFNQIFEVAEKYIRLSLFV